MYDNMIKVKEILESYSFESKMDACQYYSMKNMYNNGIDLEKGLSKIPAPWFLEMIVLLSVYYKNDEKNIIDRNTFIKVVNDLYSINILQKDSSDKIILRDFILAISAIQFRVQRNIFRELYRYYYYFTYCDNRLNVKEEFYKKFHCDFIDFCLFSYSTWFLILVKRYNIENKKDLLYNQKINLLMQNLAFEYRIPFETLSIDLLEYKKILKGMKLTLEDFYSVTRPSYAFPFIIKDDVCHLPLPHLLIISSTEFLMIRLTEGNDNLRNYIGNIVYEKYLYDIIVESDYFDEVYSEQSYVYKKQEMKTIDIMCKIGNSVLFFDRKSSVPGHKISIASQKDIDKNISVMGEACAQMYKHLKVKYPLEYNPYKNKFIADEDDKWGIVVVELDSYMPRNDIYDKAKEILSNEGILNIDYDWMSKHIIITDIDCIEKYFFFKPEDIMVSMKERAYNNRVNDYIRTSMSQDYTIQNKKILDFMDKLKNYIVNKYWDLL